MYISATKVDEDQGSILNVDLFMPLETYWDIQHQLKKADYIIASKGEHADVQAIYRTICRRAAPYAVFENDRNWLIKRSGTS